MSLALLAMMVALSAAGSGGAAPEVRLYPVHPAAPRSDRFEVTAAGLRPVVERLQDASYTRFAMTGAVPIEIRFKRPVRAARVIPVAAVADLTVKNDMIRFTLLRPANLAVLLNLEQAALPLRRSARDGRAGGRRAGRGQRRRLGRR